MSKPRKITEVVCHLNWDSAPVKLNRARHEIDAALEKIPAQWRPSARLMIDVDSDYGEASAWCRIYIEYKRDELPAEALEHEARARRREAREKERRRREWEVLKQEFGE